MEKLQLDALQRIDVNTFKSSTKTPIIVVLDNVRSMHNVGSVFRTADGFLIEKIILCGFTPQPPHREIQKTALGATDTVAWQHSQSTVAIIEELKKEGAIIYAIEQVKESVLLQNVVVDITKKNVVVFGNEVDGISNEVLSLCDAAIEIPQFGTKHSLNISVAAGIVLWKLVEQHLAL